MAATPSDALRTDVAPGDAGVHGADLDAGHRLRRVDGVADGTHRPVDVRDDALAQSAARHVADAEHRDAVGVDLADHGRHLGGADVEADHDLGGFQPTFHEFTEAIRSRGAGNATSRQ